jgi:hypothetical protein
MKRIKNIVFLLCLSFGANAQIKVQELPPETEIPTGVIVHADPRLAVLERKHRNVQLGVIRSGRGYRVQIYNGNDRSKATQIKVDFMRRFPGVRTYLTYVQPQFRVKVGDYRTHNEAEQMYNQVSRFYNPSMIVPDIIVINTLRDD